MAALYLKWAGRAASQMARLIGPPGHYPPLWIGEILKNKRRSWIVVIDCSQREIPAKIILRRIFWNNYSILVVHDMSTDGIVLERHR